MGKIIQNKKGQTTITIPKALVESLKLEKGMGCKIVVSHHNELVIMFDRETAELKEELDESDKIMPVYFG